ncbi:hypothetical protein IR083_07130 [Dysgonomonas sp. GY75]|uniref:hypothetical protein n=1 Tax=Dysgonomonas sp. GY75 TaxID=2780419 RepID=UPI001883716B|nr:hypothetical protein [Dysgonomonas sp. GY75]MBF0648587.1 hypothetical protein [Dysgonomonas sp. GY75]
MARKKILITVTTIPLPSRSYDELVCTAGLLEDGSWIRIYPMPLSFIRGLKIDGKVQQTKYTWIELDVRRRDEDFRPESHSPIDYNFKDLAILNHIDTKNHWEERKQYCVEKAKVYTNMTELIEDSKEPKNISLATFKPSKILDLVIEPTDREWKPEWQSLIQQHQINFDNPDEPLQKELSAKIPYTFSYKFEEESGTTRTLMVEDWEIAQLYWNCLRRNDGDEAKACQEVKNKYLNIFTQEHDIYFFLGTTKEWHMRRARNPFVIIGVFYPKKNPNTQLKLFF